MGRQTRDRFLHGALVLTLGMALVKVIGALFKIPLKYAIGEYGMGLFNVAYNFYGPVFSLATAGFPIAVSRMVSESRSLGRWRDVREVKRAAMPLFLLFGGAGMVLMTLFAPVYCEKITGNPYGLAPVLALAPAILCACVGSVYRGYYEGLQNMAPTAVSEVVEALIKLVLGLGLSRWIISACTGEYGALGTVFSLIPADPDEARFMTLSFAAAGAVFGVTAGSAGALLYLLLRHGLKGDGISARLLESSPAPASRRKLTRRLLTITLPIAAGSIASNAAGLIDSVFLQNRLTSLMERDMAGLLARFPGMIPEIYLENPESVPTFLYGCYTLAMTVYLLVPALTQAIGVSALPAVTAAWTGGGKAAIRERIEAVCRVTALVSFPAGLGISALAGPIVRLLYGEDSSWPVAAGVLTLLGAASLAAAMSTPLSSMLQAVGRADLPVKLLVCAMGIKLGVNFFLCGRVEWNIYGAAVGTLACYLFLSGAQFLALRRVTGVKLPAARLFLPPLACAALCGLAARGCYRWLEVMGWELGESAAVALSILCGGGLYLIGLLLLNPLGKKELKLLPYGQKIAKTLEKWGWV